MARSKQFDVDEIITKALGLFWSKGYEATSVQDLVDHLGINRGSLYSTFGSKDNLYRLAFERYRAMASVLMKKFFEPEEDSELAGASTRTRLLAFLDRFTTDPARRGCFVVNTVSERNHLDPPSLEATAAAMDDVRQVMLRALSEAKDAGHLMDGMTAELGAELILVLMQGLRVMIKAGAEKDELQPVILTTLNSLLRKP